MMRQVVGIVQRRQSDDFAKAFLDVGVGMKRVSTSIRSLGRLLMGSVAARRRKAHSP